MSDPVHVADVLADVLDALAEPCAGCGAERGETCAEECPAREDDDGEPA